MVRANSLRIVVLCTVLMAAMAVSTSSALAMAAPAELVPPKAGVAGSTTLYDIDFYIDKLSYSRARGWFTIADDSVGNRGAIWDEGPGYTTVTFTNFRRGHKPLVKRFQYDDKSEEHDQFSHFELAGRGFYKAEIEVCKHREGAKPKCEKETVTEDTGWPGATTQYAVIVRIGDWWNEAAGFFSIDKRFVQNSGYIEDEGPGYTTVTFTNFRRGHKPVVKRLRVDDNPNQNAFFRLYGRGFYKTEIEVCKHRKGAKPKCERETVTDDSARTAFAG